MWVRNNDFFFALTFLLCELDLNLMLLFCCLNSVVEFKDEDFVKKAIETMNKHDLSGRPLNIKEVGLHF